MSDADCLFCKMASGAIPVDKLQDDELVFTIRDINPRAPTHLLVIPKEHIPTASDVTEKHGGLLAHMFQTATDLTRELGISETGYRLAINVGEDGGQSVYHLHMHVLGGHRLGAQG